ncbi:hypothetical protein V1286_004071 [Bradyrhizobium algeriense]|uniref:Uncharacterized protein n=1 Tax=Bradyrhizobium algeriense TaxID=634784 RepID=A0ABU8BDC7_9BRAD
MILSSIADGPTPMAGALPDFRELDVEAFLDKYESAEASVRQQFNQSAAS